MGIITTGAHPKALWPGVHAWFGQSYAKHTPEYPDLFEQDNSTRSYEEDVQTTGFGLAPVKEQGKSTYYDSNQQGYIARYTHVAYSIGYIVTREELDDNQYMALSQKRSAGLAFSMNQTKENVAANIYNRAFNAAYAGGDGVSLINSAHPNSTGGTFSNQLAVAADLSETAIEDLAIQIKKATDDRGLRISLIPQCLVVPVDLEFEANRILKSTLQNDTANNAINAIRQMGLFPKGIKANHYLSDTDAWFIRTNCPDGMRHFKRVGVEFTQDNDFDTENAKAKAYERYSFGYTDPRGLFGSAGA